jgi:hypothetical protein
MTYLLYSLEIDISTVKNVKLQLFNFLPFCTKNNKNKISDDCAAMAMGMTDLTRVMRACVQC